MRRVIVIAVAGASLAGCSSFSLDAFKPTPPTVQVQLDSVPPGADARGIGSRRHRVELDLHGWRGRLEGVQGKRGAAGQASSRYGNHDDTTHDQSVTLMRLMPQSPHRA